MKIFWLILLCVILLAAAGGAVNYFLQRRREREAQKKGVVVYSTVLSIEPVGGWLKQLDLKKITLRIQEPGETTGREVALRTRVAAGQKIAPAMKLMVVIDPTNSQRVYPAGPEAAKRVVLTGSRMERRQMKARGM